MKKNRDTLKKFLSNQLLEAAVCKIQIGKSGCNDAIDRFGCISNGNDELAVKKSRTSNNDPILVYVNNIFSINLHKSGEKFEKFWKLRRGKNQRDGTKIKNAVRGPGVKKRSKGGTETG